MIHSLIIDDKYTITNENGIVSEHSLYYIRVEKIPEDYSGQDYNIFPYITTLDIRVFDYALSNGELSGAVNVVRPLIDKELETRGLPLFENIPLEVMDYIFKSEIFIKFYKEYEKKQLIIKQIYDLFGEEMDYQYYGPPPRVYIDEYGRKHYFN